MMRRLLRHALSLVVTLLLGGFLGCVLLRYAPGFDIDEREFDQHYSSATLEALRQARAGEQNIFHFYGRYLNGALHGDLGTSHAFQAPVTELILSRAPVTIRLIGYGLLIGWFFGVALGGAAALKPTGLVVVLSELFSGIFLCLPAAVLALFVFLLRGPVPLVLAAAIFPRVYQYSRALIAGALNAPHVLAAAARGIPRGRIFLSHVVLPVAAPLAASLGVCVTLAFGACIPVEVVCDLPGLGHLAWKAATARDLPLLAAMTLMITCVTLLTNAASDLVSSNKLV
jgi:peptide/nickel transport system permease protein